MLITQVGRHKVTDHVISAGAPVASRLPSSLSPQTKATDPQDDWQNRTILGSTAGCTGSGNPVGEALQPTADRSANAGVPRLSWGIPDWGQWLTVHPSSRVPNLIWGIPAL